MLRNDATIWIDYAKNDIDVAIREMANLRNQQCETNI